MSKETKYFLSKKFLDGFKEQVKKDTWGKGLPMIYMDDEGRIVEHWESGEIKIIKEKDIDRLIYLDDFNGEKETKITWDRTRTVFYNGGDGLLMNTYECSSCKTVYHFEQIQHKFCPFCGTKYKYAIDVSV